ncbi:MAG: carboxymethylenebutenolidase [Thiomonas sp. 13-66-29]|jgi:carboxymethylenebutenolidase|uniref:Putative Carboxymethylenebutenolidase n=1 Tax=Thiomonas delicata TaxID=364030 RepID=A0A238D0E0_THIDL|nr:MULTISPECIES: dienelactone hydrolase family protein [Thiomonas]OZB62744.1 MAG: carboxymethylenebutenolidase [Thiomonas sp. 13-66-29]SBP86695.1 putative Carboxymethylenebutenolidase [Thiomonas delicata]
MGKTLALKTADGQQLSAYLAEPTGPSKGGIVVMQEIFGVNPHIRSVADRYAAAGYTAIAPAVFDPVEKNVELGYDQAGMQKGLELVGKLGFDSAVAGVDAAAKAIASAGKVGIVGYCWGGSVAYLSAIRLGLPAVSYYGGRNAQLVGEKAKAPLLFHYGLKDAHISEADREAVRRANPDAEFYVYDADHGFNCDARASFDAPSAKLAMERSLAFFAKHLG